MTTTADRPAAKAFKVVGTRPIRHDGYDKVTGRAQYGADVKLQGLLQSAVLRSPHAHARIKSIDTSKAAALPGVKAIITGHDFPEVDPTQAGYVHPTLLSGAIMARDKALYKGHAIVAIAASSLHIAQEAADLVKIEYEVLPPVTDVREAMKPGAPILHDKMPLGEPSAPPSNVAKHFQIKCGDIEKGFKEADLVVEREFTTASVHMGYIEPHSATAFWGPDGKLTVWNSSQGGFMLRTMTASVLNIPHSSIKVVPMEIGGGFGGKTVVYLEPIVALLARKAGAPVKMTMSRKEVFESSGPAPGSYSKIKIGVTKDGRITAVQIMYAYEAGAMPGAHVAGAASTSLTLYRIENAQSDGYDVVVNKPKATAYRAPGAPQVAFGIESILDELAEKLGMDPIQLRLKNANKDGDRTITGAPVRGATFPQVAQAVLNSEHYKSPLGGPNRGRGFAAAHWHNAGQISSASMNVNANGTISLVTGSVDVGGLRPALAMQVAEVLSLKPEDISPSCGDTDSVGYAFTTGGSRSAMATGLAAITAANSVVAQMKQRAAVLWETRADEIDFVDGYFIAQKNPNEKVHFKQLAQQLHSKGGPVNVSISLDASRNALPAQCAMLVDVEVDPETGKVTILRATIYQDVGQAAHPSYVEGQMQGAVVQGIGWALNEGYYYNKDGSLANSSFLDYRMPTALDLPMIDAVLVQEPNPNHPFGLKGVGEASIIPPMPAVANAIYHATGIRMQDLPINPGRLADAIRTKQATSRK